MNTKGLASRLCLALGILIAGASAPHAQPGTVRGHQKISDMQGEFGGALDDDDFFGFSVANVGDLDNNGVNDLIVGSPTDDDGGDARGAVWVLFLRADGTVQNHQKISDTEGGFEGALEDLDFLGASIEAIGDLDDDGIVDVAVSALGDDEGDDFRGAVWILFLNEDGTVKGQQKISSTAGGFSGVLEDSDFFGGSLAGVGDLDGDGVEDLVVGAPGDDDGGSNLGAAWVLFLNTDGTVKSHQKISSTEGGFKGQVVSGDNFCLSLTNLGDLDGDGVEDVAAGANRNDDGGDARGAVWVLFLNADGTVKRHQKISNTEGGFTGELFDEDLFGESVEGVGDVDGDGIVDLAVGADSDDDGGLDRGAVWVLFLDSDGTVKGHQKISDTEGGFTGALDDTDNFGQSMALLGDLDGDGAIEIAVGAEFDDDGGMNRGAVWVLFLDATPVYSEQETEHLSGFRLSGAYPNPFNPRSTLTLELDEAQDIVVEVLDALGRRVALLHNERWSAGVHTIRLDAQGLASGVYTVRARGEGRSSTRHLTLLR